MANEPREHMIATTLVVLCSATTMLGLALLLTGPRPPPHIRHGSICGVASSPAARMHMARMHMAPRESHRVGIDGRSMGDRWQPWCEACRSVLKRFGLCDYSMSVARSQDT